MKREDQNKPPGIIKLRIASATASPPCSLAYYRHVAGSLPRPSDEQVRNFVEFVSEAHSWYKHLPLLPPGIDCKFFIDPYSGYDHLVGEDGRVVHKERTDESQKFHYTWMTTQEYRSRFGHLSYECKAGLRFFLPTTQGVLEYADHSIFYDADGAHHVPDEIGDTGHLKITAIVHRGAAEAWVWRRFLPELLEESPRRWPQETGGDETLNTIIELCNPIQIKNSSFNIDRELEDLIRPERLRLQTAMHDTIHRMLDLIF